MSDLRQGLGAMCFLVLVPLIAADTMTAILQVCFAIIFRHGQMLISTLRCPFMPLVQALAAVLRAGGQAFAAAWASSFQLPECDLHASTNTVSILQHLKDPNTSALQVQVCPPPMGMALTRHEQVFLAGRVPRKSTTLTIMRPTRCIPTLLAVKSIASSILRGCPACPAGAAVPDADGPGPAAARLGWSCSGLHMEASLKSRHCLDPPSKLDAACPAGAALTRPHGRGSEKAWAGPVCSGTRMEVKAHP